MKIEREGNLTRYVLRQSDLNTFFTCNERARQLWTGEVQDFTSAEAAIGTAVHFAIQLFVDPVGTLTPSECLEAATERFRGLSEEDSFRWVGIKTVGTAEQHITNCFNTFLRDIYPLLGYPLAIEQKFRVLLYHWSEWGIALETLDSYEIILEGTIDFIDDASVWDWKTGSRLLQYTTDSWQLDRWAIQPTVYTYAAHQLGYFEDEPVPFTYAAMQRTPCASATHTVWRDQRHWDWLTAQCLSVVHLHQADARTWPVNDQHALCSDKWCPAWGNCKGQLLDVPSYTTQSGFVLTS